MNVMASSGPLNTAVLDNIWVSTLSIGPLWTISGKNQTFYLTPEIEKTYSASKSNNTLISGAFFLGLQKNLFSQWLGQLGLVVAVSTKDTLQGTIWDDADPQFDNYRYQYKIQSSRVAVQGKLLINKHYRLMPWISGSLGVGFNHAYGFTNTPLIYEALPNDNFSSQTRSAFTYSLGAGLQQKLNQHWQVGMGYEFVDWGRSQLARAACQRLNSGLQFNHVYTNGILFNLTYIA